MQDDPGACHLVDKHTLLPPQPPLQQILACAVFAEIINLKFGP